MGFLDPIQLISIISQLINVIVPLVSIFISFSLVSIKLRRSEPIKNYIDFKISEKLSKIVPKFYDVSKKVDKEYEKLKRYIIFSLLAISIFLLLINTWFLFILFNIVISAYLIIFIIFYFLKNDITYNIVQKIYNSTSSSLENLSLKYIKLLNSVIFIVINFLWLILFCIFIFFSLNYQSFKFENQYFSEIYLFSIEALLIIIFTIPGLTILNTIFSIEMKILKIIKEKFLTNLPTEKAIKIRIITKHKIKFEGYIKSISNDDYLEIETKEGKRIPIFWNEILYVKI